MHDNFGNGYHLSDPCGLQGPGPCGSAVEKIYLIRFLAGSHKRRLNWPVSVLSPTSRPRFLCGVFYVVQFSRATVIVLQLLCIILMFCLLVVLVRLSVPVQAIGWKDLPLKCHIMC